MTDDSTAGPAPCTLPRALVRHIVLILGCAVRAHGEPSPAMLRRVAIALAVARELPDVTFVPVGGVGRHPPAEALVMAALLERAGVSRVSIHPVPDGATTLGSLRACLAYLRQHVEARSALVHVCTDAYHVRRCRLILLIWGIRSRGPGAALGAACSSAAPSQLAWMSVRDWLASFKDVPLALLWRLRGARGARPEP